MSISRAIARLVLLSCGIVVGLTGCGGGGVTDAGPTPQIVGRLERGSTVQVLMKGVSSPSSPASSISINPATAGTVSGSTILFLQAGSATITASRDGNTGSVSITVGAPPTLYFDAINQGNRDIYSSALDGLDRVQWTTNAFDDQEPTVAKGQLVFTSSRNGNFDLYAITLTSGANTERRLTTAVTSETQPSLSPDATRLVFANDVTGLSRLWIGAADATGAGALTPATFGAGASIEVAAKWSTAGDRLVFASTANGRTNLFTMAPTSGANPAAVVASTAQATDVEPAWSPDGNRIVFASTRAGGTSLFTVDVRDNKVTQLTSGSTDGQPVWLADGRIVFTRFSGSNGALFWIDPDIATPVAVAIALPYTSSQHATSVR